MIKYLINIYENKKKKKYYEFVDSVSLKMINIQ